jgi:class 3 adenylate cyclase/pimeloyl-ACP methyl ester carboxylesterase
MDPAPTRYVDRDGAALAYQVIGSGPVDVVYYMEINQHLDLCWTDPHLHQHYEHAATYSRTAMFQRRGLGLSDPIDYVPTIEQQADDILAVMDEIGMTRALIVGIVSNCGAPALVAARTPHRVSGLVLVNPMAQGIRSAPGLPEGWTAEEADRFLAGYGAAFEHWGSGQTVAMWDSVLDTSYNRRLLALMERCSASPATAAAFYDWVLTFDVRDILRSVQVPVRVIRNPTNAVADGAVRHAAELIPTATLHVLPETKPGASVGEGWVPVARHIEEAATGGEARVDADRFLGTVLFTDVVGSTDLLAKIGDARYRELRADHERQVRLQVETTGGRLVKVIGDGTLSVFDGPTAAVRAAESITESANGLGIAVRAGVHTGEIERAGPDIHGMSVHIGARVAAAAGPGEVLVSRTVHDLVLGSGLRFEPRGQQELKGIPGTWELFVLAGTAGARSEAIAGQPDIGALDRAALETARRAPALARTAVRIGNAWQRRRAGSH